MEVSAAFELVRHSEGEKVNIKNKINSVGYLIPLIRPFFYRDLGVLSEEIS